MKELIAIKHVPFEGLGSFEPVFSELGYALQYLEAGKDSLSIVEKVNPDLLVICGGPISANDEKLYPFLFDEFSTIEKRIRNEKATLGICLGAQVIAKVLGAKVYANKVTEIGWSPLQLTEEGMRSPLRHLNGDKTMTFHWHGETFDIPKGAIHLASTTDCLHQAYSYKKAILGLQCHPEVIAEQLEQWYIGHACELSHKHHISIEKLRQDGKKWGATMQKQGKLFIKEWISNLQE